MLSLILAKLKSVECNLTECQHQLLAKPFMEAVVLHNEVKMGKPVKFLHTDAAIML
jgi:hypothetical protein